jgi:glyoxylase-like metal-dependent hydrolase (beta-lactamase superfamily II)/ferredoxin
MADLEKMVPGCVDGEFFVDTTCINCDTCRQLAPHTFVDQGEYSQVYQQPAGAMQLREATRALLCCPTGSIGTRGKNEAKEVMRDLPLPIAENVYYSGFNSAKSYGGNSFFVTHEHGNWLIDSPKFLPHLVQRFEQMGGIKYIFLTHQDDVADASRYAEKFGAQRIIHKTELQAQPDAELVIDGEAPHEVAPEFLIIPVPGHTQGHMVLLYRQKYLFTGDHLAYDKELKHLMAFRRHCWYSWEKQTESMEKLASYKFEWVLAGHGDRTFMKADEMRSQLVELVDWMKLPAPQWYSKISG